MGRMEHRGRHATGLAITKNGKPAEIYKWAAPAQTVIKSTPFREAFDAITKETTVLQGHVRHATHANANDPNAAHPFQIGKIVGAHNGIIYNWREVDKALRDTYAEAKDDPALIVDSEAIFMALDLIKDPVKATDMLDGYWAATWVKGRSLFLCRTQQAPLTCAYIGKWKALVWHSERTILQAVLHSAGAGEGEGYDIWDVKPGTIYRYMPNNFDSKTSRVEKRDAPFRGRRESNNGYFNSARPGEGSGRGPQRYNHGIQTTAVTVGSQYEMGSHVKGSNKYGGNWDYEEARERTNADQRQKADNGSVKAMREKIDQQGTRIVHLANKVHALEMDLDLLFDALTKNGITVAKLLAAPLPTVNEPVGACVVCRKLDETKGRLVHLGKGQMTHEKCIFADEVGVTADDSDATGTPD